MEKCKKKYTPSHSFILPLPLLKTTSFLFPYKYLFLYSRIGTQVREGRGVLVKKDGTLYEGWFCNNKFHGRGRVISAQGDMYEGELRDGKESGVGTFIWADGSKYVGAMKDGLRCGYGKNFTLIY